MKEKIDKVSEILFRNGYYEFYSEEGKLIFSISKEIAAKFVDSYFDESLRSADPGDVWGREARKKENIFRGLSVVFKAYDERVFIYLPADNIQLLEAEKLVKACGEFMDALDYEVATEKEPIIGSYIQDILFRFKKGVRKTSQEIKSDFDKGKKALELKCVELPTAEQTERLTNSAAKIVELLEKQPEGVVRLGALLVLKKIINGRSQVFIQQLNFEQIRIFDKSPHVLQNLEYVYLLMCGELENRGELDEGVDADTLQ